MIIYFEENEHVIFTFVSICAVVGVLWSENNLEGMMWQPFAYYMVQGNNKQPVLNLKWKFQGESPF